MSFMSSSSSFSATFLRRTTTTAIATLHTTRSPVYLSGRFQRLAAPGFLPTWRSFATTLAVRGLNESAPSSARDDVARHNEQHKQEQLKEQEEGKGRWKRELSSDSEGAIKADRGDIDVSSKETVSKMQKETAEKAEREEKKEEEKK